jgi:uncharacterized protein (TIGR04141 family)
MDKKPIIHLRFRLIKESINRIDQILIDKTALDKYEIRSGFGITGAVYVAHPKKGDPDWFDFVQSGTKNKIKKLTNRSNKAILLIKLKKRIFAVTFGHGRELLQDYVVISDFGIKTALNSLQHDSIRSVDTYTFEEQTVHKRAQASKVSSLEIFGLDVSKDILRAVTGKTRADIPFESVYGKEDVLAISVRAEFSDLKWVCDNLLSIYSKNIYKKHFSWVDKVKRVPSKDKIEELNNILIDELKKKKPKCHLSPPEPINWEKYYYFGFTRGRNILQSDMNIADYQNTLADKEISVELLKHDKAYAYYDRNATFEYSWSIFKCIVFEAIKNDCSYVLTNGEWYEIDKNFSRRIKTRVNEIPIAGITLPAIQRRDDEKLETEGDYNLRASRGNAHFVLLDKKLVNCDTSTTPVEICDIFSDNKEFIHVKHRSGGSSAFSHLFAQGRVSAELLMSDQGYRKEIRNKLRPSGATWAKLIPINRPRRASIYSIIYAFLGTRSDGLASGLPFFSQLTLMRTYEDLISRGFNVFIYGIEIESTL